MKLILIIFLLIIILVYFNKKIENYDNYKFFYKKNCIKYQLKIQQKYFLKLFRNVIIIIFVMILI